MSEEHASDCIAIPTLAPATHSHMYGVKLGQPDEWRAERPAGIFDSEGDLHVELRAELGQLRVDVGVPVPPNKCPASDDWPR